MPEVIVLTRLGYDKLEKELAMLQTTLRPKSKERIKQARSFCDFHEDAEYEAALDEQRVIAERIDELRHIVNRAKIIPEESFTDTVELGAEVELVNVETRETMTYIVVASEEVAFHDAAISMDSPLGKALLGEKVGAEVTLSIPAGKVTVIVQAIR